MTRLAIRNLFQSRARLAISAGGVALALALILSLDAILAGMERQITAYVDHSGADVFVAQSGVRNMHMAASSLAAPVARQVKAVPGVESVTPILYLTNTIGVEDRQNLAYIIGLPARATVGGPWQMVAGEANPAEGEIVIDRGVAEALGVGLGDEVKTLGDEFRISGLADGTASLFNSVAFISKRDFVRLRGNTGTISYLLVKVKPGESPQAVAAGIEARVRDVTAEARPAFAGEERRVVRDMSTDVVTIMNLVGFLIGLAVVALTVYTATLSRRAEYGVLRALGARNRHLYYVVLAQAVLSVAIGLGLGLMFTLALATAAPHLSLNLALEVKRASLLKVGGLALLIAGLAALLPIRQIAGLDPALVFRGR